MRRNCIENIQNEINAKITAHTHSDRDFIVFRPKSFLINPLIYKKTNPMTSIFQLQGKRRNETLLMKLRCKTKEVDQKSFELDDHLHIQKCKTFKKFKLNKDIHNTTLDSFKVQTSQTRRNHRVRQTGQVRRSLKRTAEIGRQRKSGNLCLGGIQKKKCMDSFLLNQNVNNNSSDEKENFSNSMNINRLRPSQLHQEIPSIFPLNMFQQNILDKNPLKPLVRRLKDSHKRLQTELPINSFLRLSYDKPKKKLRMLKNLTSQHSHENELKDKIQRIGFDPWQTAEVVERPQEFDQFENSS